MLKRVIQILAAVVVGNSVLVWAVQAAYTQRGYQAIGGEYLLAVMVAVAAYYVSGKI